MGGTSLIKNRVEALAIALSMFAGIYSSSAIGALITFDFSATIYSINRNSNIHPVAIGDQVTGFFTYDTAAATPGPLYSSNWRDYLFNNSALIQLDTGNQTFARTLGLISVVNDYHPIANYFLDRLYVASNGYNAQDNDYIQLWVDGLDTTAPSPFLTSVDLPMADPNWTQANFNAPQGSFNPSPVTLQSPELAFTAYITSVSLGTRSVPEPDTICLLGVAFLGIVVSRKRKCLGRDA